MFRLVNASRISRTTNVLADIYVGSTAVDYMLFGVIRINASDTGLVLLVRRLVVFPPVATLAGLLAIFLAVVVAGLPFVELVL